MRRYTIFFSIIAATVTAVFAVRAGYYPLALVGGDILLARDFRNQYRAARTYYENVRAMYGAASTLPAADMERAVFTAMIEGALVHAAVREEIGTETARMVAARVDAFLEDADLLRAADAAYGVGAGEFRAMVLVPQAEREILTGQLFLRGEKFEDWLAKAKRSERVVVLAPGLHWDGAEVQSGR
ncbi:MAG: hypothetical protein HYW65_03115 [Candidatus Liptonbacteria bacterium]|nr:hypothetical protein [Candidatus Liptonbacteria bacterium]